MLELCIKIMSLAAEAHRLPFLPDATRRMPHTLRKLNALPGAFVKVHSVDICR
jgi:hypothetical protein